MDESNTDSNTEEGADPCQKCLIFLDPNLSDGKACSASDKQTCPVCLGIWQNDELFQRQLTESLKKSCDPYGTNNRFSSDKEPPAASIPGDIVFRYQLASSLPQYCQHAKPTSIYLQQLKYHLNNLLTNCIENLEKEQHCKDEKEQPNGYPDWLIQEEQGFLACFTLLVPPKDLPRPSKEYLPKTDKKKSRRKQFETQGGHPRSNLERSLQKEGVSLWPVSHGVEMSAKWKRKNSEAKGHDWFFTSDTKRIKPLQSMEKQEALQIHAAVWRRPFLVQGHYTKARRDVSQTPFFIHADNPKKRQRLGISSIEEQILPAITDVCGGISTLNNSPDFDNVIYGKAKFHASGREDMDVRMILPTYTSNMKNISGRPFCCEVIDALRMPTVNDLQDVVKSINHTDPGSNNAELMQISSQYFGCNPLGVGIDPDTFSFGPGEAFKNLQSETEQKHKYYGCLCWSQETLPPQTELERRLTMTAVGNTLFPLELQQQTPIRVLHRRANTVRIRHIVSCPLVERLDDHYFRLHISTDAGTYVKEFCHGDLGRTQPNVSTLLGCGKADILELDCEGIQMN